MIDRPLGSGPDAFLKEWPTAPLLILGPDGSGRRTWAEYLMQEHGAKNFAILRADDQLTTLIARSLGDDWFRMRSRVPRYASFVLDGSKQAAQNAMLKTLEELPKDCRVILRARPGEVMPTIKSRCVSVRLQPGKPQEEMDLLEFHGIAPHDAETLVELRPGRPGAALALAPTLSLRTRANSVLSAAEARDYTALSLSLGDYDGGTNAWLEEWLQEALAYRTTAHGRLAKEAGPARLSKALEFVRTIPQPRLAARAVATVLAMRPE